MNDHDEIPISHLIAAKLKDAHATSEEVECLLGKARAEVQRLEAASKLAWDQALDPTRPGPEVDALRREAEETEFRLARLARGVEALEVFEDELEALEAAEALRAAYRAAEAERDRLVKQIKQRWPGLSAELAELIDGINASNAVIVRVNRALPEGAELLEGAESKARGFRSLLDPEKPGRPYDPPMICQMMVPGLEPDRVALRPRGWVNDSRDGQGPRLRRPENSAW